MSGIKGMHDNKRKKAVEFEKVDFLEIPETITDERARLQFMRICSELKEKGLVNVIDLPVLEAAFISYQMALEAHDKITESKTVADYLKNEKGLQDVNLVNVYTEQMKEFKNVMFKFGVTPYEAQKIKQTGKEESVDPADAFIKELMKHGA